MKSIKSVFHLLTGNMNVKCHWCGSRLKKRSAFVRDVKRLEFVYPKTTFFCDKNCHNNYVNYEVNSPRKISMCNSCPVPDLPERSSNISKK